MSTQKENSATALTKTNRRYAFAQKEGEDHTCIKLTEGQFADVIYKYGKVSIPNEDELNSEGDLPFRFQYVIVDNNEYPEKYFKEDFRNLIGDILVDIIDDKANESLSDD